MVLLPTDVIRNPDDQKLIHAVKQCISATPTRLPSLEDISKATGASKKRISDVFRRRTGMTVARYLRDERMRRAQRLLVQTSIDIHVIARDLGFSSSANFSNAFREYVGMTPTEFRNTAPIETIALQGSMHWSSE